MKKILFYLSFNLLWTACITAQTSDKTIKEIETQLQKGRLSVTEALTNKQWMSLHSQTGFREVIKQNAKAEKISLAASDEPGLKTTIKGVATDKKGRPISGALVYVYHTSAKGWYADTAAHIQTYGGDVGHARLFGYLKTDAAGQFEFETIRPEGYPNSDLPAHIHIALWSAAGQPIAGMPGELLFEEDKRLTPERKTRALQEGYLVAKNAGTNSHAVYAYQLVAVQ